MGVASFTPLLPHSLGGEGRGRGYVSGGVKFFSDDLA